MADAVFVVGSIGIHDEKNPIQTFRLETAAGLIAARPFEARSFVSAHTLTWCDRPLTCSG